MAKQTIFLGTQANDGTGDSLRLAFDKVNDNFDEVYTAIDNINVGQQVNADWNATEGIAQILNKPTLFSGNYNDLSNKPTLFSGSYTDLTDKPQFPYIVSAPLSSLGQPGDVVGMYSYTSEYFYYCSDNHDGETHIWKRVAWDNQVW